MGKKQIAFARTIAGTDTWAHFHLWLIVICEKSCLAGLKIMLQVVPQ